MKQLLPEARGSMPTAGNCCARLPAVTITTCPLRARRWRPRKLSCTERKRTFTPRPAGCELFNRMLQFLRGIPERDLPAMANIGVVDDGSPETGELMNLLSRRNLLYRIVTTPDPHLDLNIRLGSKEYPKSEAANPSELAQKIRAELTDEKRLLRVYGSEVVIARLTGAAGRVRIHLLNYANRPVIGLRVRVLGDYPDWQAAAYDHPDLKLEDFTTADGATEFTVPKMSTYAVIDLSKRR